MSHFISVFMLLAAFLAKEMSVPKLCALFQHQNYKVTSTIASTKNLTAIYLLFFLQLLQIV